MTMKRLSSPLWALAILAINGCGSNEIDIHAIERDSKAWETAPVDSMSTTEILDHLDLLGSEMSHATQTSQFAEMHHLEIALTKALVALESNASEEAIQTIDTLKIIAAKIHVTGHDQNQTMAGKLDQTLKEQLRLLRSRIQ